MESTYNLAVIGSGPGGYVAAIRAGQLGLKTAIIEKEALGGACLNWGCIPTKALLKNAEIVSYIRRADEFGLKFDAFHPDYSAAMARSRRVVDRNTRGVRYLLRKNNVTHIEGAARLTAPNRVAIEPGGAVIQAKNIIIATGARPRALPALPVDGQRIISSRESIVLTDLPQSMAIIGGGAIGVEFAYIYAMYGVDVTIIELLPRLVPNEDADISGPTGALVPRLGHQNPHQRRRNRRNPNPERLDPIPRAKRRRPIHRNRDGPGSRRRPAQHRKLRLGNHRRSCRPPRNPRRRLSDHHRPRRLRHRRRHRQNAPRPRSLRPSRHRRRASSGPGTPAYGIHQYAPHHLLQPPKSPVSA